MLNVYSHHYWYYSQISWANAEAWHKTVRDYSHEKWLFYRQICERVRKAFEIIFKELRGDFFKFWRFQLITNTWVIQRLCRLLWESAWNCWPFDQLKLGKNKLTTREQSHTIWSPNSEQMSLIYLSYRRSCRVLDCPWRKQLHLQSISKNRQRVSTIFYKQLGKSCKAFFFLKKIYFLLFLSLNFDSLFVYKHKRY